MAVLYINEHVGLTVVQGNAVPAPEFPPVAEQTVAITAGSVQSSAFNAKTRLVGLTADAVCSVAFGANPTAAATNLRLAAGGLTFFRVQPGHKVAVITNT